LTETTLCLTLKAVNVTKRWNATQQHKLWLAGTHTGIIVKDTTIDGSAAAGIFINGASGFTINRVTVLNSMADGIHMTNGSHHGVVRDAVVRGAGDDGVAVVSYLSNPQATHDIQVINPKVYANTWGRGVSVVGGPIGVLRAQVLATVAAPLAGTTGLAQPAGPHPIADAELGGRWRCHHLP